MITLKGMTWGHPRVLLPMVATEQRFAELNPEVQIHWESRSLKDFEEFPPPNSWRRTTICS
jgi:multiple sugar transport system substrate-binding protein